MDTRKYLKVLPTTGLKGLWIALILFSTAWTQNQLNPIAATRDFSFEERGQLYFGIGVEFIDIRDPISGRPVFDQMLSFTIIGVGGLYSLLYHPEDIFALNACSELSFGIKFADLRNPGIYLQLPLFVMFNYGSGATPYNEQAFGIGVGAGVNLAYLQLSYVNTANAYQGQMRQMIASPAIVAEINPNFSGGGTVRIRGHYNLLPNAGKLSLDPFTQAEVTFQTAGIQILYGF